MARKHTKTRSRAGAPGEQFKQITRKYYISALIKLVQCVKTRYARQCPNEAHLSPRLYQRRTFAYF